MQNRSTELCQTGLRGITLGMVRPCFLVADQEHASSISTRKLVIETAKLNAIITYSGSETVETLRKFPGIDGIIVDENLEEREGGISHVPAAGPLTDTAAPNWRPLRVTSILSLGNRGFDVLSKNRSQTLLGSGLN